MKLKSNPFHSVSTSLAAAALCLGVSAFAADYTWGGGDSTWTDTSASGWNGGVPLGGDTATINNGNVTTTANNQQAGVALTIGSGGVLNGPNYLYFSGGSLTLNSGTINVSFGGEGVYRSSGLGAMVTANSGTSSINNTGASYGLALENGGTTFGGDGNLNLGLGLFDNWADGIGDGITKNGAGTLTITAGSGYTGNTSITAGKLEIGGAGTLGSGSYGGTIANDGILSFASSADQTLSGAISGSGTLTKSGAGKLTLSVGNSFTGATTVNGGTLELAAANNALSTSSGLTINNGGTVLLSNINPMGAPDVPPVTINSGGLMTMSGNLSVNLGSLTLNGGELSSAGFYDGTYGSYFMRGDMTVGSGTSTISAVNITSGGVRSFDVAAAGTLNVTGNFSSLYGSFGLTKTGNGTMILAASNDYTGGTLVSAGTLLVTGALGDSAVVVDGGAFGGTGTIGGSLAIHSGLFHVADLFDALDVSGTVTLFSGFGIDDLTGIDWGSVADGTYNLINGSLGAGVFAGLANNSLASAQDLGGGRKAYFQEGSLQLVVVPEPGSALLGGLGLLVLWRRRR